MEKIGKTSNAAEGTLKEKSKTSKLVQMLMSINIFKRFMRSKRNDDESSDDEEDKFSSNTFRNNLRKGIYGKTYGEDEFMEAFSYYDTNGDGKITTAELNLVLKKLKINMKKREIKAMIQELDKDRTGFIDYIEFSHMMTRPAPGVHSGEYELREAFRCIDLDGSGYISKEELKDMVQKIIGAEISEKEIDEMMDEADIDGDNLISFDEFVKILVEKRF